MWKLKQTIIGIALVASGAASITSAQAALLGVVAPSSATSFDSVVSGAALIWDADYYSASEGRLIVLSTSTSLKGPGVPTGTPPSQTYFGAGDALRNPVLEVRLNNSNGDFVSGSVVIPLSNDAGPNDSWTYSGSLTGFGFASNVANTNSGTTFDATWDVTSYNFSDVASNPGLVGAATICSSGNCGTGGLLINSAGAPITGSGVDRRVDFSNDWVRGISVISGSTPSAQLGTYDDIGFVASEYANSTPTMDVFMTPVPEPESVALMAGGLVALGALSRRRRTR